MLPAIIKRDLDSWTYQVYVTDTLQTIAENTAVPATGFTDGRIGKAIVRRWIDLDKPVKKDSRTGDDIDRELSEKFGWVEVRENEFI